MRILTSIAIFAFLSVSANVALAQEVRQLDKITCAKMASAAKFNGADAFILIAKNTGEPTLLTCGGTLSPLKKDNTDKVNGHSVRLFSAKWIRLEVGSHCYWYEGDNNTLYKYCPPH